MTTVQPDVELVLTIIHIFRDAFHAYLERLLVVELESQNERMLRFGLTAEALAIAASAHAGNRDEFMRMARDAYALKTTGELEQ